jgi:teichoic acid transport system permease protein
VRELWRRREFAVELARTKLREQNFDTVFGQLWLVINPLLMALVYFLLVDIIRAGRPPPPGLLRAPWWRASSCSRSSRTR